MLHAILHGKAGRIEREGESLCWRDLFKGSEDLLTATFFGRLPHLSDGALHAVLRFLLGDNPLDPATFQRLANLVEPDDCTGGLSPKFHM